MPAHTAIRRRNNRLPRSAPFGDHPTNDRPIDGRLISETDHDRVDLRAKCANARGERRRKPVFPLPFSTMFADTPVSARRTASASDPTTTQSSSVSAASVSAARRAMGAPSSGASSFCEPNRRAPPAASNRPAITRTVARQRRAKRVERQHRALAPAGRRLALERCEQPRRVDRQRVVRSTSRAHAR